MIRFDAAVGFISDLHVGSRYSIWPEYMETKEGNPLLPNPGQLDFLKYWKEAQDFFDKHNVTRIFDLSDAIDGKHIKDYGEGTMTPELEYQKTAYKILVTPMIRDRKYFVLSGSKYHESLDSKIHRQLADDLKGTYLGTIANVQIPETGTIFNLAHGNGGGAMYISTKGDREALMQLASQALNKIPKADVIVRGHLHRYNLVQLETQTCIQLPCWKAFEPNPIFIGNYGRFQSSIGVVVVGMEGDQVHVLKKLFPLPNIADMLRVV